MTADVTSESLAGMINAFTTAGQRAVMNGGMAAQLLSKVKHLLSLLFCLCCFVRALVGDCATDSYCVLVLCVQPTYFLFPS